VCFLQIFEAWELLVEVLSQVKNLLRHIQDLILTHLAHIDETGDDLSVNQLFFLELFTNLQGNVDCSDGKKRRVPHRQIDLVH